LSEYLKRHDQTDGRTDGLIATLNEPVPREGRITILYDTIRYDREFNMDSKAEYTA